MDAYILNFNNYFNRQVKRFDTVDEYLAADSDFDVSKNINFNPADGITATLTFNTAKNGNYLLIVDPWEYAVVSRWFVMEQKYQRNGQCTLTLRRDVVADFYNNTINAPCFIEKGKLPQDDPMIFNSEGMQFNRIKNKEILLSEDDYNCGWIVGYCQKPANISNPVVKNYTGVTDYDPVASIESWDYAEYMTTSPTANPTSYFRDRVSMLIGGLMGYTDGVNNVVQKSLTDSNGIIERMRINYSGSTFNYSATMPHTTALLNNSSFNSLLNNYFSLQNDNAFFMLDGKTIYDMTTQKYYTAHIRFKDELREENASISGSAGSVYTQLFNAMKADTSSNPTQTNDILKAKYVCKRYYVYLEEITSVSGDLVIDAADWNSFFKKADDADYCIFCIPCPRMGEIASIHPTWAVYTNPYTNQKSMAMAQLLVSTMGVSNLIDLQLLPYCPIKSSSDVASTLNFKLQSGQSGSIGDAFCIKKSSFKVDIEYSIKVGDKKLSNECDSYRLVSPNYSTTFEFSPAKNGNVKFFHVECTYKPFTPYINVHPYFDGLYGQDFDDNRGLILGGDYSLPVTSDAFKEYQIQNKNYSNIFDRQMQNIDKQNTWGLMGSIGGAVAGTVQGAAMGSMAGPAGAIAGGIASAIGGALDVTQSAVMMAENKDLQKDMYAYQLGNIDSKPNSLVKSSAFDITFRMWPFVEFSTCTDVERKALENKIAYNGMTVMRIGTINEFLEYGSSFVKGQIIRLENLAEDNHLAGEIYNEIAKGVYF